MDVSVANVAVEVVVTLGDRENPDAVSIRQYVYLVIVGWSAAVKVTVLQ